MLNETDKHDIIILMGDMNANVGKRALRDINALGNEAFGASNENVHLCTTFWKMNNLIIGKVC